MPLLYVDDSENDRHLVQAAISLTKTPFAFYEANGMESAMPYFQAPENPGQSKKYPRPEVVLLDYDLGNHTGADVLYWLRIIKSISSIPVVMFSGSPGRPHIAECYAAGANHFISKPKNLERLKSIVGALYASFVSLHQPGPIQLLEEYRPNPRENPTNGSYSQSHE